MRWGAFQFLVFTALLVGGGSCLVGCGGTTRRGFDDSASSTNSTTGAGGSPVLPDAEPDAQPDADLDAGIDAVSDVVSDYVDPGCPDAEPPVAVNECDPLATPTGCDPGLACYPFVERPEGDGCEPEVFGTMCLPPGGGQKGDRCGEEYDWCGAGLLCVVGAISGARCLELCDPFGPDTCPSGLVCAPVDVEGYGVCG